MYGAVLAPLPDRVIRRKHWSFVQARVRIPHRRDVTGAFEASLQAIQRITEPKLATLGFQGYRYKGADVILDGGIGGYVPTWTGYFLDTKFLKYRPHTKRNFTTLSPETRNAWNQDMGATILVWAGNVTCSGRMFQGYFAG